VACTQAALQPLWRNTVIARSQRRPPRRADVKDLPQRFRWLFEGLSPDEIEDRLAYHADGPIQDVRESIERLIRDERPRIPAKEMVYDKIVPVLLDLLRRECGEERAQIAEEAARFIDQMCEAASHGATRGEQRAAVLFRHPDIDPFISDDARSLRSLHQNRLFRAIQIERGVGRLTTHFEPLLSDRKQRQRNSEQLFQTLTRDFPELGERLKHPQDIVTLTPGKAALTVVAARLGVSETRARHLLAEAREVIRFNRSPSLWVRQKRRSERRKAASRKPTPRRS
jgi:hypothetical protein